MKNIAYVGFTGSEIDISILGEALIRLSNSNPDKEEQYIPDFIDLKRNRDFLFENFKYDAVVLMYIFVARFDELSPEEQDSFYDDNTWSMNTSPLHSKENWKKRLIDTGAQDIMIFGYNPISEITDQYLDPMDGYEKKTLTLPHGTIWHYSKGK